MQDPPFDQLYQSIHYPEQAFNLYLCPNDSDPSLLSKLDAYQVPAAFSEPLIYLLFKIEKKSGYARLHIETEIFRKGPKLLVKWESGTSERGYLDESEFRALKHLARNYFYNQVSKHGFNT